MSSEEEYDELAMASYVILNRIYDALMLLLDEDDRAALEKIHADGRILGPEARWEP